MIPDLLKQVVESARSRGLKPDVLYLVPVGQNPTGLSMSEPRKREIYKTCQELGLIILEDDAYYYLHYGNESSSSEKLPGIKSLPKSFLSLDTDGRVLRFDSLSKVISPGMRLGWISGPSDFIEKYVLLQEVTAQFPCGVSQSVFLGLVKSWGDVNMHSHFQSVQQHYKNQRDVLCGALHPLVEKSVVSFQPPSAGMFLWMKILGAPTASSDEIFRDLAANGVVTVSGDAFKVKTEHSLIPPSSFIRLSFANALPSNMREAASRISNHLSNLTKQTKA